jgi:hypothetical protein
MMSGDDAVTTLISQVSEYSKWGIPVLPFKLGGTDVPVFDDDEESNYVCTRAPGVSKEGGQRTIESKPSA